MRGKSSPALFELIQPAGPGVRPGAPASGRDASAAPSVTEPSPEARRAPEDRAGARRWVTESATAPGSTTRFLGLPVSGALVLTGGVIALCVIIWAVAFSLGWRRGEERALSDLGLGGQPSAPVREPSVGDIPANNGLIVPGPAAVPGSPAGPLAGDPRVPGLNYLVIATLDPPSAERLREVLGQGGVQAFTVPLQGVDPNRSSGNNPPLVMVYASLGLTGAEIRAQVPAMKELEDNVARLGQRWKREFKGTTDFSDRWWKKYTP